MVYTFGFTDDKVAFISGAASGMGKQCALLFAEAGVKKLVLVDVNGPGLDTTAKEIGLPQSDVLLKALDLTNDQQVAALFDEIEKRFGRLDYAINAAGVSGKTTGTILETPQSDWDWVMNVNFRSMTILCRHQIGLFLKKKRAGDEEVGSIVNFGSWSSFHGHPATPHYTSSKFAVAGLTKSLCLGYASSGIRVNGVAPGVIDTAMLAPQYRDNFNASVIPQARLGRAEEVANMVLFLASPRASFVNGTICSVDGGMDAM